MSLHLACVLIVQPRGQTHIGTNLAPPITPPPTLRQHARCPSVQSILGQIFYSTILDLIEIHCSVRASWVVDPLLPHHNATEIGKRLRIQRLGHTVCKHSGCLDILKTNLTRLDHLLEEPEPGILVFR